ncbi:MAG: homoserine dehydrogenase [Lachnospiraceae bacterium]|nr:homoserine dehydrogenase [Lachnospiraceae bacterium]
MKVAIFGFGTVGSGVYDVINMNNALIEKRAGKPVEIKYVLDLRDFPGNPVEKVLVHDVDTILNDPEVGVIAEVMGGENPAYKFTKAALEKGKSVCTSNKELVAKHGAELLEIAKAHNCSYLFEASVGGGIPILRSLTEALTADDIQTVRGIVNGTTNYILSRMGDAGLDFDVALKEAQDNGFAERNPSADIDGIDAQRKTSILASLITGKQVDGEDIYTEGITKITATDIEYAKSLNAKIKLFSVTKRENGNIFALVAPFMVRENNQLYTVNNVFNAILVTGNAVGDVMFYGSGAGKLPTASAVVGDIVELTKFAGQNIATVWSQEKLQLTSKDSLENKFFVRVPAADTEKAEKLLGVSEKAAELVNGEAAFITEKMTEADFEAKAAELNIINRIRVDF